MLERTHAQRLKRVALEDPSCSMKDGKSAPLIRFKTHNGQLLKVVRAWLRTTIRVVGNCRQCAPSCASWRRQSAPRCGRRPPILAQCRHAARERVSRLQLHLDAGSLIRAGLRVARAFPWSAVEDDAYLAQKGIGSKRLLEELHLAFQYTVVHDRVIRIA